MCVHVWSKCEKNPNNTIKITNMHACMLTLYIFYMQSWSHFGRYYTCTVFKFIHSHMGAVLTMHAYMHLFLYSDVFISSNINHKALTFNRINVAFYSFDSTQRSDFTRSHSQIAANVIVIKRTIAFNIVPDSSKRIDLSSITYDVIYRIETDCKWNWKKCIGKAISI